MNLYILVGGRGSRLGRDKPSLRVGDSTILARLVETLSEFFDQILLVGGEKERARHLDLPHLPDVVCSQGPLAGLVSSLRHAQGEAAFVMAGDMPFVSPAMVRHMLEWPLHGDALVPAHGGFLEPLFAIYRSSCLPAIEKIMAQGRRKVTAFYDQIQWIPVPEEAVWRYGHPRVLFLNINTKADWDVACRLAGPYPRGTLGDGRDVPVVSVSGSQTGRMELVSGLLQLYSDRGLHVVAAKHAGRGFSLEHSGNDIFFLGDGEHHSAQGPVTLRETMRRFCQVDLVIAEGCNPEGWPEIEMVSGADSLGPPAALGFVGREPIAETPFPFFTMDQLPSLVAHVDLLLEIN